MSNMTTQELIDNSVALLDDAGLNGPQILAMVSAAIDEDLGGGVDVTTTATTPAGQHSCLKLVAKAPGVVSGAEVAALVFAVVAQRSAASLEIDIVKLDSDSVSPGDVILRASSLTTVLLTAERTALNFLGHLSGVSTKTNLWVQQLEGTGIKVRDTRKTIPLYRELQKYAVRCGGGVNHRMYLSDAGLIKDNHVEAAGSVAKAFELVTSQFPGIPVEVEVDTLDQLVEALGVQAKLIMLDNFTPADMAKAVTLVREFNEEQGSDIKLEASGGLNIDDCNELKDSGVDFIAIGELTHSAPVLDISAELHSIG